ncbi:FAD-binding oxidoreductase [Sphingomonas sp.]|uniref:NAD(P)/FAD-dependent oxidoreductase n=1 Tax=Sphingomonas sp. TaxID=28214 RepID=UPI0025D9B6A4|nr:FAD-binding oxidoreductase [Sphingomonas sp.]
MTEAVDILVIGGGIAGLSCAARLAGHASVVVLEREDALGYHSSGRSATWLHLGIGTPLVRALTMASAPAFAEPPADPEHPPLSSAHPALFIARESELDQLATLERGMRSVSQNVRHLEGSELTDRVPVLRVGGEHFVQGVCDEGARRIDSHALLQSHTRAIAAQGGKIVTGAEVLAIRRAGERWVVDTPSASWSARTIVNAAGAWADRVAEAAGVRPLGLQPMRRTIIGFDAPEGQAVDNWPFLKTVIDDGFYMLPDAGKLLASPMDVTPTDPADAQPEEIDVATAAWRVEEATTIAVRRIAARWAGLRSFFPDGNPAVGYDAAAEGFFWLAGQGGAGLQTSPALSAAAAALVLRQPWPEPLAEMGIDAATLSPARL